MANVWPSLISGPEGQGTRMRLKTLPRHGARRAATCAELPRLKNAPISRLVKTAPSVTRGPTDQGFETWPSRVRQVPQINQSQGRVKACAHEPPSNAEFETPTHSISRPD